VVPSGSGCKQVSGDRTLRASPALWHNARHVID
jgi:hypothetical protein